MYASQPALAIGIAVLLALSGGCASKPRQTRISSPATIAIVQPAPGAVLTGETVRVQVKLVGGKVIPETRLEITPDEGHIHLSLNGTVLTMTYGLDEVIQVAKGPQLLQAEFVAADHLPFNPRVTATVTFTVR